MKRRLLSSLIFLVVANLVAFGTVISMSGHGSGDLFSFAVFSLFGAVVVFLALVGADRLTQKIKVAFRFPVATVIGILTAMLVTLITAKALGPWVGAFSFNIFLCWTVGATFAFSINEWFKVRQKLWLAVLSPVLIVGIFALSQELLKPPKIMLNIRFKAGTPYEHVSKTWDQISNSGMMQASSAADSGGTHGISTELYSGKTKEDANRLRDQLMDQNPSIESIDLTETK